MTAPEQAIDPVAKRAAWRRGTVIGVAPVAEGMVSLTVRPERRRPHLPGQYYDIRVPGTPTVGAFSIVSSPNSADLLEFGVSVQPQGLLSPRLATARAGDQIELRGPVGRGFTWTPDTPGRLVLIGAGAGITPLLSMYVYAVECAVASPVFIVSAKRRADIYGLDRLPETAAIRLTDEGPRIDTPFLSDALAQATRPGQPLSVRICGPLTFVGTIVESLRSIGVPDDVIRSEGFV